MNVSLNRCAAKPFSRPNGAIVLRLGVLIFLAVFVRSASGQFSLPEEKMTRSVSGQFFSIATSSPSRLTRSEMVRTNSDFIQLDPALLAISAERIRESLWREIGSTSPWRGKIYLVIHPAQSFNDEITIVARQSGDWNYQVQLPDVTTKSRFLRAMTGVLLLEIANRNNHLTRAAEIPAWLADGLSKELEAQDLAGLILLPPEKVINGMPLTAVDQTRRGFDELIGARKVLQNHAALTFEQLSWPMAAQLTGDDGGVYNASAQLFVHELLDLPDGAGKLRAMLGQLPDFYNWQTAFQKAFRANFANPLAVEKWWALEVVDFVARAPGSRWTATVSRDKLDEILQVPVAIRVESNALPTRAEISLQVVIRNFDTDKQTAILRTKLRDLQLAQLRMASPLAVLTDGYRRTIAAYLGDEKRNPLYFWNRHPRSPRKADRDATLKKLDDLDGQRREIEAKIQTEKVFQSLDAARF
ncbi:MAG TPA: hypothetical protein VFV23_10655 [Verrucomicrobiae bacterium]|nr:hypothetical protein [Verrucomicrobiae bacterium]